MRYLVIVLIFISTLCNSQIINFPDSNFKARLLAANTLNGYACIGSSMNDCIPGVIDTNNNGEIETSEAEAVVILFLSSSNISDLTGIEYFSNLERLDCAFNPNLASIDLSALTSLKKLQVRNNQLNSLNLTGLNQLEELSCQNNQLTSLDINEQTQLEWLLCEGNQISSLNFSNNPALQRVYCGNNLLTTLDFGTNPQLFDLGCQNNPNLASINIKNGMTQVFGAGTLYNQCWNNLPSLNYICADDNEVQSLQSFLSGCEVTQNVTIDSSCPLGVNEFNNESFVVYPNPSSGKVYFSSGAGKITKAWVVNGLGQEVVKPFDCVDGELSVDLSGLSAGVYFIKMAGVDGGVVVKRVLKR